MDKDELTCKLLKTLDLVAMLEETTKGDLNSCAEGIRHTLDAISGEIIAALEGLELLGEEE